MHFKFFLAETSGFCWGVKRAIHGAEGKERKAGEPIYVLGSLVHNREAVQDLEDQGIHVVQSVEAARGKTLLVTAHGRSPKDIKEAGLVAREVLNMTCPIVQDLHAAALRLKDEGRRVVLIGMSRRPHPEVEGVVGVLEGKVTIIEDVSDVATLPFLPDESVGIVAQTTFNTKVVLDIVKAVKARFRDTQYILTICDDIERKQDELRRLGPGFDTVVVVGDTASANATHLAEIARDEMKKRTLFILNGEALSSRDLWHSRRVLVIAGASTPPRSVNGVCDRLRSLGGEQSES